jgi:hypothetical protein
VGNIFQDLRELPVRRAIQVLRNRISDIGKNIDGVSFFDQHPGKRLPWCFSKTYLIDGTVDPATVNPSTFLLPQGSNILTGRDASFHWCETNAFAFAQRNEVLPNAGLFDAVQRGGGATYVPNVQGGFAINNNEPATTDFTRVCFELDLYDRRRGRSITNGKIPGQTVVAGSTGFRRWREATRWDPDTEIEPRLYVNEAHSAAALATANHRFFVNITFKGYLTIQEVSGRETMLAGEDDGASR